MEVKRYFVKEHHLLDSIPTRACVGSTVIRAADYAALLAKADALEADYGDLESQRDALQRRVDELLSVPCPSCHAAKQDREAFQKAFANEHDRRADMARKADALAEAIRRHKEKMQSTGGPKFNAMEVDDELWEALAAYRAEARKPTAGEGDK